MSSIADSLERIQNAKDDLKASINAKNSQEDIITDETIDEYASFVDLIPQDRVPIFDAISTDYLLYTHSSELGGENKVYPLNLYVDPNVSSITKTTIGGTTSYLLPYGKYLVKIKALCGALSSVKVNFDMGTELYHKILYFDNYSLEDNSSGYPYAPSRLNTEPVMFTVNSSTVGYTVRTRLYFFNEKTPAVGFRKEDIRIYLFRYASAY